MDVYQLISANMIDAAASWLNLLSLLDRLAMTFAYLIMLDEHALYI